MPMMPKRLPTNQQIQIERRPSHVRQDPHTARRHLVALAHTSLVLVQHAGQEVGVARSYRPVLAHGAQGVDKEGNFRVEAALDGAAVDEQDAGGDPEGERKGRAERREQVVLDDEFAQGEDVVDGVAAGLGGHVGRREDGRAHGRVRGRRV